MSGGWILGAVFLWGAYKLACWLGEKAPNRTDGLEEQ